MKFRPHLSLATRHASAQPLLLDLLHNGQEVCVGVDLHLAIAVDVDVLLGFGFGPVQLR